MNRSFTFNRYYGSFCYYYVKGSILCGHLEA